MDIFSRIARFYDRIIPSFSLEKILPFLELKHKDIIVDLGGGTGRVSVSLLRETRECIVIDVSLPMLKQAKKKSKDLYLIVAKAEKLPIRENSVDKIIVNDTFHHIMQWEHVKSLAEMYLSLKEDGTLLIREFDRDYFWNKPLIIFEKLLRFKSTFYTPCELKQLCINSNFNVEIKQLSRSSYLVIAKKKMQKI